MQQESDEWAPEEVVNVRWQRGRGGAYACAREIMNVHVQFPSSLLRSSDRIKPQARPEAAAWGGEQETIYSPLCGRQRTLTMTSDVLSPARRARSFERLNPRHRFAHLGLILSLLRSENVAAKCAKGRENKKIFFSRPFAHFEGNILTLAGASEAELSSNYAFNNCLAITNLWISDVPSPIVQSFESRQYFSAG